MAPPDLEGTAFPVNIGPGRARLGRVGQDGAALRIPGPAGARWRAPTAATASTRAADVHTLRFIKRARDLGFSMAEIAELVSLWHDQGRASANVKRIAQRHVDELAQRIESMQAMQRSLQALLASCHGDSRPDCPILDDLAGTPGPHCH
jgi:MerR family copper efflux transcriptional regulator